jgi:hypothetical protein
MEPRVGTLPGAHGGDDGGWGGGGLGEFRVHPREPHRCTSRYPGESRSASGYPAVYLGVPRVPRGAFHYPAGYTTPIVLRSRGTSRYPGVPRGAGNPGLPRGTPGTIAHLPSVRVRKGKTPPDVSGSLYEYRRCYILDSFCGNAEL